MQILADMDASDYADRFNTRIEWIVQDTYAKLGPNEKQWIDARIDVSKFYDWARLNDALKYTLKEICDEYVHTYNPIQPVQELFQWIDMLLHRGTHQQLSYDSEYLVWNISRCRECMTQKEIDWVQHKFSIDNVIQPGVYSEEDVFAFYDTWNEMTIRG